MSAAERPIGDDDLHAYVDGQVAPERREAVESYLGKHPAAAANVAADVEIMALLRARLASKAEEPIPPRLRVANIVAARHQRFRRRLGAVAAAVGWLVLGAAGGWGGSMVMREQWGLGTAATGRTAANTGAMTHDAMMAYLTFAGEKLHPVEVRADQEGHLVQWLSRRVGQPLTAPDLSGEGFELMGGRLLPAGSTPAAMFMYDDGTGNRLTLYARVDHAGTGETGFQFFHQDRMSAFAWVDRDICYVVTGTIDRPRLLAVAQTVYKQLSPGDRDH